MMHPYVNLILAWLNLYFTIEFIQNARRLKARISELEDAAAARKNQIADRDKQIAVGNRKVGDLRRVVNSLRRIADRLRHELVKKRVQFELAENAVKNRDGIINRLSERITGLCHQRDGLEAELKARIETDTEKSAELARTIREREDQRVKADYLDEVAAQRQAKITTLQADLADEKRRVEGLKGETARLRGMNIAIEKRLTDKFDHLDDAWKRQYAALEAEAENRLQDTEKRVRDGYSKGYALGLADAFEKVRQLLPASA